MHAAIFDIDGTLLNSNDEDGLIYRTAIRSVIGPCDFREDWGNYTHVTHDGILHDVLTDNEIVWTTTIAAGVKEAFFELLQEHLGRDGPYQEIPGARNFVESLTRKRGVVVAYATGAWRTSAELKLRSAGFPLATVPLASSEDSIERTRIMRVALNRLGEGISSVTYYGDGDWDRVAADELGWHFEPVGEKLNGIQEFVVGAA